MFCRCYFIVFARQVSFLTFFPLSIRNVKCLLSIIVIEKNGIGTPRKWSQAQPEFLRGRGQRFETRLMVIFLIDQLKQVPTSRVYDEKNHFYQQNCIIYRLTSANNVILTTTQFGKSHFLEGKRQKRSFFEHYTTIKDRKTLNITKIISTGTLFMEVNVDFLPSRAAMAPLALLRYALENMVEMKTKKLSILRNCNLKSFQEQNEYNGTLFNNEIPLLTFFFLLDRTLYKAIENYWKIKHRYLTAKNSRT